MSSTNSPTTNLLTLIDAHASAAMFEAVRSVAEQSFFAVAVNSSSWPNFTW